MASSWESALRRWTAAGLLDSSSAERIRGWEAEHRSGTERDAMAAIAFVLGGVLLIAGTFLFVASHWEALSPGARFALVLSMVALFHIAGASAAGRAPLLAMALHLVGTAALGAGIFLCGQIFHMAEHWPGALLLWLLGATAALTLLRDSPHTLCVAVLLPAWLWGEWLEGMGRGTSPWHHAAPLAGTVLLAIAYLAAPRTDQESGWRGALAWLGAVALLPAGMLLALSRAGYTDSMVQPAGILMGRELWSWAVAAGVPFVAAWAFRGRQALYMILPTLWCLAVVQFNRHSDSGEIALYGIYALGALGLAAWGVKGQRRFNVNLGVLAFALTVIFFYFSNVFDKLGRSLGLIGTGILFLAGGWLLERVRRNLIVRIGEGRS